MRFEERIERLVERHEALAQSVEMHNMMLSRLEAGQAHQREMLDGLLTATDQLVKAAGQHEVRLRNLEKK